MQLKGRSTGSSSHQTTCKVGVRGVLTTGLPASLPYVVMYICSLAAVSLQSYESEGLLHCTTTATRVTWPSPLTALTCTDVGTYPMFLESANFTTLKKFVKHRKKGPVYFAYLGPG